MDAASGATGVEDNRVRGLRSGQGRGHGGGGSEGSGRDLAVGDGVGGSRRDQIDDEGDEEERDGDEDEDASVPLDLVADGVAAGAGGSLEHLDGVEEAAVVVVVVVGGGVILIGRRGIGLVLEELGGGRRSVADLAVGGRGRALLLRILYGLQLFLSVESLEKWDG